jgi:hypothetical protein
VTYDWQKAFRSVRALAAFGPWQHIGLPLTGDEQLPQLVALVLVNAQGGKVEINFR